MGMVKGPSFYDPRRQAARALERRNLVLSELVRQESVPREDGRQAGEIGKGCVRRHDQDHGGGWVVPPAMGQHVEAVAVAQADVDQHKVVLFAIDRRKGLGATAGRIQLVALLPQPVGRPCAASPVAQQP